MEEVRRLTRRDVLVPAALFALGAFELSTLRTEGWVASIALELLAAGVLVFRRLFAGVVAPLTTLMLMAIPLTGARMDEVATPVAFIVLSIFCMGRYVGRRGGLIGLVLVVAAIVIDVNLDPGDNDLTDVVFVLALAVPPYIFGQVSRRLADQTVLLRRQQEQIRDQAVRDERDRITRELHDVIAHSISAMVVQTAAAQDLVRTQPERAATLLETVARTGRDALAETGRLLHLIRDESDELGLTPARGLVDVPELVAGFKERGLAVEASVELPAEPVPAGVDLSAYRVIQEALTNAAKHGASPVFLDVAPAKGTLRISCSNAVADITGHGAGLGVGLGAGLGLQGMAERVSMVGGSLSHGVNGDGRFHLDVTMPLDRGLA